MDVEKCSAEGMGVMVVGVVLGFGLVLKVEIKRGRQDLSKK